MMRPDDTPKSFRKLGGALDTSAFEVDHGRVEVCPVKLGDPHVFLSSLRMVFNVNSTLPVTADLQRSGDLLRTELLTGV